MAALPTGTTGKYDSIHPGDRRLVGLDGAADMLALSRSKVHLLIQAGELETVRIGRRLLIPVSEIDAYIERLRRDQKSVDATNGAPRRGAAVKTTSAASDALVAE